jgi:heme exporter protein C
MTSEFLWPLLLLGLAYMSAFGSLWLVGIRSEVWRRRAEAAALRAARA